MIKTRLKGRKRSFLALTPLLVLTACVTPVGPVEVTRFHQPDTLSTLGQGTIAIVPGADIDGNSIVFRTWSSAIGRELTGLGYRLASAEDAQQLARISFGQELLGIDGRRSPVSVGVGGSTGSFGSGVGVGIGINLGGGSREKIISTLELSIVEVAHQGEALKVLWEGRAVNEAPKGNAATEPQLAASKLATALFTGFPGRSGETIAVE